MRTRFFIHFITAAIICVSGAAIANAANQVFLFSGTQQTFSTTLTNPYDNATFSFTNGTYFVNNSTYNGQGSGNTLLMTNATDFFTLDSSGVQTLSDVQRIFTGNGNDVVDLANTHSFSEGDCTIFTGTGNCLVWGSAANEIFNPQSFTNHNIYDGGPGTDTVVLPSGKLAYTINQTGPGNFSIVNTATGAEADVSEIEFAQFTDQTLDLSTVPEPASISLLAIGVAGLAMRGKRRSR